MSYLELIGVVFGLIYVLLNIRQNIWCWPAGLVNVSLFLILFYQTRLYAEVGLQAVYIVLSIYGWYYWLRGGNDHTEAPVSRLPLKTSVVLLLIGVVATVGMGWSLSRYTDADLAYWDSTTTVMSLIGQWMTAKKILENWIVWIVVDVLYVGIYFYKELYLTTGLFALYLVLAVLGYRTWKRSMHPQAEATPA